MKIGVQLTDDFPEGVVSPIGAQQLLVKLTSCPFHSICIPTARLRGDVKLLGSTMGIHISLHA